MKKEQFLKIFYVCISILLITLTIGGVIGCIDSLIDTVHAEELNTDSIYNFNQIFEYNVRSDYYNIHFTKNGKGNYSVSGTGPNWNVALCYNSNTYSTPLNQDHKYFYRFTSDKNINHRILSSSNTYVNETGQNVSGIFTALANESVQVGFYYTGNTTIDFNCTPYIIDLTEMFGAENEPTVEQANIYFPLEYYTYSTGTLLNLGYLDAFNKGAFSMQDGYTISVVANDFINNAYNINASDYSRSDIGITFNGKIAINTEYTLIANDYMILDLTTMSDPSFKFDIIVTGSNGQDIILQHIETVDLPIQETSGSGYNYGKGIITLKLPTDTNTIYFKGQCVLNVNTIKYKTFNYSQAIVDAYRQGQDSIDKDAIHLDGYNKGYAKAQIEQGAFKDGFNFLSVVFNGMADILSIEFIPNVPIWSLLAIPVLLGVIALVRKLVGE